MSELRRELLLGAVLVAMAAGGLGLDLLDAQPTAKLESSPTAAIVERANFCPPLVGDGHQHVSVATTTGGPASVRIEPDQTEPGGLPGNSRRVNEVEGEGGQAVTGFDQRVVAGSTTEASDPVDGSAAVRCSESASPNWYFPEGSTVLGADERIVVFNPFPDEAVVEVTLFTPSGDQTRAGLSDVAVPAGETVELSLNDYARIEQLVSARVRAERGRVVAWRYSALRGEDLPTGVEATLGAPRGAQAWYFPEGGTGEAFDERIALLNPTDEEATVNIVLSSSERVTTPTPEELVQIPLPPLSSKAVSVPESGTGSGRASVRVVSVNGVDIVAERTLTYEGSLGGVSSEVGSTMPASRWVVPPAAIGASEDTVSILNPGSKAASVDVTLISSEGSSSPKDLRNLEVLPGLRRGISLDDVGGGSALEVVVTSDRDVVVERESYSSATDDTATLMGTPLTPSGRPLGS